MGGAIGLSSGGSGQAGQNPVGALSLGGFLSSLLGLQHAFPPSPVEHSAEILSPEQTRQAFLSRLLLLLGSFVILCLLLF